MVGIAAGTDVLPAMIGGRRRIRLLLIAGVVDSAGLAFGWTVSLLLITDRLGVQTAALLTTAMLIGVALSAPFGTWLTAHLSPQRSLKLLAVGEGLCRLSLLLLVLRDADATYLSITVTAMNVLAWCAFALMRSETARVHRQSAGRLLTLYAIAIAASEALAAAVAALVVSRHPTTLQLALIGCVYVGSLLPQWLAARGAAPVLTRAPQARTLGMPLLTACSTGGLTFLVAAGPALLSTVLAYELYGTVGVAVSAVAFAAGTLGATHMQTLMGFSARAFPAAMGAGAVLVGGWIVADRGIVGLAVAQCCAGLAQCALEGDLDERVLRGRGNQVTGLALGSASRALGGAAAAAALPVVLTHWSISTTAEVAAGGQLAVLSCSALVWFIAARRRAARHDRPSRDWTITHTRHLPQPRRAGTQAAAAATLPGARDSSQQSPVVH